MYLSINDAHKTRGTSVFPTRKVTTLPTIIYRQVTQFHIPFVHSSYKIIFAVLSIFPDVLKMR